MTQGEHFLEENMSKWIVPPLFYMPPTKAKLQGNDKLQGKTDEEIVSKYVGP
jgi:hypothetical protein